LAVSVGAAVYPDDGDSLEAVLEVADSRMYTEKRRRNEPATHEPISVSIRPWSPAAARWDGVH